MFELRDIEMNQKPGEKFCLSFCPNEKNANVNGKVHGGISFLLCDEAIGRYVTSLGRKGAVADANIHYYRPAELGKTLYATVSERKTGKKLAIYLVELTDSSGKLLADTLFTVAFAD